MRGGARFGGLAREIDRPEKGILVLAWISYLLAAGGGAAMAATFIGGIIAGFIGLFPQWVSVVAFLAMFLVMAIDLIVDGIPNRAAVGIALVLPSAARAVPGKLGREVTDWGNQLLAQINQVMGEWVGTTSAIGVAIGASVAALLVARRVVDKGAR